MSTTQLYLVSRFSRRDEMREHAEELRVRGVGIVVARWLTEDHEWYGETGADKMEMARRFAADDYEDLHAADMVIVFTEPPNPGGRNRGGRHVEYGLALAWDKVIIIVGPAENVFHTMRATIRTPFILTKHFTDWSHAIRWLSESTG